jgi:hypothetical protein
MASVALVKDTGGTNPTKMLEAKISLRTKNGMGVSVNKL